eukprot:COSAG01_NODE_803_length_13459_cov_9.995808_8_plen_140_part_00
MRLVNGRKGVGQGERCLQLERYGGLCDSLTSSVTRAVASTGTGRYGGDASKGVARGRAVMADHRGAPSSDSARGHTRRMNVVRAVPSSGTHGQLLLPPSLPPSLSLSSCLLRCVRVTFSVSLYPCAHPPCAGHGLTGPT